MFLAHHIWPTPGSSFEADASLMHFCLFRSIVGVCASRSFPTYHSFKDCQFSQELTPMVKIAPDHSSHDFSSFSRPTGLPHFFLGKAPGMQFANKKHFGLSRKNGESLRWCTLNLCFHWVSYQTSHSSSPDSLGGAKPGPCMWCSIAQRNCNGKDQAGASG